MHATDKGKFIRSATILQVELERLKNKYVCLKEATDVSHEHLVAVEAEMFSLSRTLSLFEVDESMAYLKLEVNLLHVLSGIFVIYTYKVP